MPTDATPDLEDLRLEILAQYRILDTEPEPILDDLTQLAAQICDVPIALISLVDETRQWFKSKVGLDVCETPRELAFCAHAIQQSDILIVPNTLADQRFVHNRLVTDAPHIRFYAGAPLITPEGQRLGTLCVIDQKVRSLSPAQLEALQRLSRQVMSQLELRRTLIDLTTQTAQLKAVMSDVQETRQTLEQEILHYVSQLSATNQNLEDQVHTRQQAELLLHRLNQQLEQRVAERTAALAMSNHDLRQEIVDREQAELSLRASEQRFHLIAQATNDAVWDWNLTTNQVWWNEGLQTLFGYEMEQVEQTSDWWYAQIHPEDRERIKAEMQAAIAHPKTSHWQAEYRYRCADGSYASVVDRSLIVRDERGNAVRMMGGMMDVSDLKQVEAERDRLFDLSLDIMCISSIDGYFKRINPAFEQILGYTDGELLNQPFLDFVHPEDIDATIQEVQALGQGIPTIYFENRYRHKAGHYCWIAWTAYPIAEKGLIYGVGRDVTAQKQIEQTKLELLQREQQARSASEAAHERILSILESITDGFFALDRDWRFTYVNSQAEVLLQRRREDLVGQQIWTEFEAAIGLKFYEEYQRAVREKVSVIFEEHYPPLQSWFSVHAYPSEEGLSVYFQDITQRKQAETELLAASRLQRAILDSTNYTIISTDVQGTILTFNAAAERLLGYQAAEVVGQITPEILHDAAEVEQRAAELSQELGYPISPGFDVFVAKAMQEQVEEREWTYIRKDGSRFPVLLSVTALWDEQGNITGFLGIGSDITERKQAEASQRRLVDVMEAAADFIGMSNAEGRTLYLNRAGREMMGFDETVDVSTVMVSDYCPAWAAEIVLNQGLPTAQQQGKWSGEIALLNQHGEEIPVSQTIVSHTNADGGVDIFSTIIRDIRDRKQMEQALRDSEERWQLALQGNNDGIWDWNLVTNEVFYSARWTNMLGYEEQDLSNQIEEWRSRVHPLDRNRVKHLIDNHFQQRTPFFIAEYRMRCKDGSYRWILDRGQAQWDKTGRPVRMVGSHTDITQQKLAEQALRESEARYRGIVEDQTELISRFNLDGKLTFVNDAYCRYFEQPREALLGKSFLHILPASEWQTVQQHIASLGPEQPVATIEHRVLMPDGRVRWHQWSDRIIVDDTGQIIEIQSVGRDVTERRRAEEILRNIAKGVSAETGAAFFQSLVRYLTKALQMDYACIAELIPSTTHPPAHSPTPHLSPHYHQLQTIAFYGQGHVLTNHVYDLEETPCQQVIETQQMQVYTHNLRSQFPTDAKLVEMGVDAYIGVPLFAANGQILGLMAVFGRHPLDQSQQVQYLKEIIQIFAARAGSELERQQAEAQLQQQHLRSQLFAEISLKIRQSLQIDDILQTSVDEVQKIFQADRVLVFQVAADGSGSVRKEALADHFPSMMSINVTDRCLDERYLDRHRHGRVYTTQDLPQLPDGQCLARFMKQFQIQSKLVMPILQNQQLWGLLIAHQCSHTRQWNAFEVELLEQVAVQIGIALAQARLLQQETQQRQELARSNADLEQFAYVASHDLQEPLRMVVSYLQLIARRYQGQLDEDADEFIGYAVDGAKRMQSLIRDLLSYSRVGTRGHAFRVTDCNEVVQQAVANLQSAIATRQAQIMIEPLPILVADATQLVQLFQNLISNAIKFSHEQPQIRISAQPTDTGYEFQVEDNGIGIHPEYRDRIFLIFQRLHPRTEYPGTGIGLALCKKIVERHQGRIWVESEPGVGTVFHFTLPAQEMEQS